MNLLWIVDAQKDFIDAEGRLSVKAPAYIRENMRRVVEFALKNNFATGYSMDWHAKGDKELSLNPDFVNTYPMHCIAGTEGSRLIDEVSPSDNRVKNIVLKKSVFDIWDKSGGTPKELEAFVRDVSPDTIYVIGVATDVCVRFAVLGFLEKFKNIKVVIVKDAVCGITVKRGDAALDEMQEAGASLITADELIR
jgi:nicotinamidase/pyrazinamidase